MILRDGYFQADPHPGNILIGPGPQVALLDFGQTKRLPEHLRLKFAELIVAMNAGDILSIGRLYR